MNKNINFTKDPIWTLLKKLTIPASTGTLFQTLYNIVDIYFAGKISPDALAAIAKSFPIYFIIISASIGIGSATSALIGNFLGSKQNKKASIYLAQSISFSIILSLFITLFGLNFSNYLLSLIGSDPENIILTRSYLDIIFFGTIVFLIQVSLNGALNAQGDTKSYRNILIISFFLNIILNPIFIWGYGFIPAYGVSGLAIATLISQIIGTIYLTIKIYKSILKKYLLTKYFIPKIYYIKNLFIQSIPTISSMLLIGIAGFITLYYIGFFGDFAVAGFGTGLRIEHIFLLPIIGLNTAVLSIAAHNFGAFKYERIKDLFNKAIIIGSFLMIISGFIIYNLSNYIPPYFTNNEDIINYTSQYLKIAAFIGPTYPIFLITSALFQALKKPIIGLNISLLRLTVLPFVSLWYVINIRRGDFVDIFYTLMIVNWLMAIAVIIYVRYFLNNAFKQKTSNFYY